MAKAKTYKYDLPALLKSIPYKNEKYYSNLSEEEQKAVSPLIAMRSLTGTTSAKQVFYINELVNPFVFNIGKHKELLIDLMTLCTFNAGSFRKNGKPLLKKLSNAPVSQSVIMEYFGYNSIKATDAIDLISKDDIISIAEEMGKDDKILKSIKKELKARK